MHELIVEAGLAPDLDTAAQHGRVLLRWRDDELLNLPGRTVPVDDDQIAVVKAIHAVRGWSSQGKACTDLDVLRIAVRAGRPLREAAMVRADRAVREFACEAVEALQTFAALTEEMVERVLESDSEPLFTPPRSPVLNFSGGSRQDDLAGMLETFGAMSTGEFDPHDENPVQAYELAGAILDAENRLEIEPELLTKAATAAAETTMTDGNPIELMIQGLSYLVENGSVPLLAAAAAELSDPESGVDVVTKLIGSLVSEVSTEMAAVLVAALKAAEHPEEKR